MWFSLFVCMFILLRPTFQLPDYLCASLPVLARPPGFRSTHICSGTMTLPLSPRRCSVGVRVIFGKPQPQCMDNRQTSVSQITSRHFHRNAKLMFFQSKLSFFSRLFYAYFLSVVASSITPRVLPPLMHASG